MNHIQETKITQIENILSVSGRKYVIPAIEREIECGEWFQGIQFMITWLQSRSVMAKGHDGTNWLLGALEQDTGKQLQRRKNRDQKIFPRLHSLIDQTYPEV